MTRAHLVLALALAAGGVVACGGRSQGGGGGAAAPRVGTGATVELTLPALDDGEVAVAAYRGKVVVLHVFAAWSMEATADVPQLAEADARDDVVVIGVALDLEGRTVVAPWRSALGVDYLIALGDDAVRAGQSALGAVKVVPTTFVLDPRGRIVRRFDRPLAEGELARAIAEAAARR